MHYFGAFLITLADKTKKHLELEVVLYVLYKCLYRTQNIHDIFNPNTCQSQFTLSLSI